MVTIPAQALLADPAFGGLLGSVKHGQGYGNEKASFHVCLVMRGRDETVAFSYLSRGLLKLIPLSRFPRPKCGFGERN